MLCLVSTAKAQNRSHTPHGGQLKSTGYYRIEVVDCSGYLEVYLYTIDMRLVRNGGLSGEVDFHYPDSSCLTVPLFRYGNDGFTAEAEKLSYSSCRVFIRGLGLNVHATFDDLVCRRPDN